MNERIQKNVLPIRPESVPQAVVLSCLVQLISRPDADLDEIAKLISAVPPLRNDLLRIANNENLDEDGLLIDTVEEALMRCGISCVVVLVLRKPIADALVKTFATMFSVRLTPLNPRLAPPQPGEQLLGSINFSGTPTAQAFIRLSHVSAGQILGAPPEGLLEATQDMLNIMRGNFKANLHAAGFEYQIGSPKVETVSHTVVPVKRKGATSIERMAFRDGDIQLFLDITANSWRND
jgi:CheY-specific phosphatase CheX